MFSGALVPIVRKIPITAAVKKNRMYLYKGLFLQITEEKATIGGTKLAISQRGYSADVREGTTSMIPMLNVPSNNLKTFRKLLSWLRSRVISSVTTALQRKLSDVEDAR
jgi:hypothetical protein